MRSVLLILALAFTGHAATLLRIACGSPGGTDAAGNVWQADAYYTTTSARWDASSQAILGTMDLPYRALRYSAPTGSAFSYSLPVPAADPGTTYVLKLFLQEPNKTAAGLRVFDITVNGATVKARLDLYAETGGALKPYILTVPIAGAAGTLAVKLVPAAGTMNAVISGIQLDSVPLPPPPPPSAIPPCEFGLGDGTGAMFSFFGALPPLHLEGCWNTGALPMAIQSVRCWSNGTNDNVLDVMVDSPAGLQSILSAPILCPAVDDPVSVPVIAGAALAPNRRLHFMVRIMAPIQLPDDSWQQSPKQIVWTVTWQ